MKNFCLIVILLVCVGAQAKSVLRLRVPYTILSDEKVTDVPKGFCRVKGNVINEGLAYPGGIVSNYNMTHRTNVDSNGNFSFLIPDTDSIIFFFAYGKEEIVTNAYDFKSQHEVTLTFYTYTNEEMMIVDKPVIYTYAENETKAHISLDFEGEWLFTYPQYDKGWDITVSQDGLRHQNTIYPYLFWEGEMPQMGLQWEDGLLLGSFLKTDTLISFFEDKLTQLGLNEKEQTDFITYWAPRINQYNYAHTQFLVDEAYGENIAELQIVPEPDHVRRVYLLFKGYDVPLQVTTNAQNFEPIDRNGFTVIEWGGSEIK